MILFVQGNLFESPAQVITNTVNCVGVMGKGVALEFKRRYPGMFEDYQAKCTAGEIRPGQPYLWEDDTTQILNFPTKDHWRGESRLEYIERGLRYIAEHYDELGIHSIAMPPLGCGNGGLDWADVKALMIRYLGPIPHLEVYVYAPVASASLAEDSEVDGVETLPIPTSAAAPEQRTLAARKIFHGTTEASWIGIQESGLHSGYFATDQAFALKWKGADAVILEATLSDDFESAGIRSEDGLNCQQFTLKDGVVLAAAKLRRIPESELEADLQYLQELEGRKKARRAGNILETQGRKNEEKT